MFQEWFKDYDRIVNKNKIRVLGKRKIKNGISSIAECKHCKAILEFNTYDVSTEVKLGKYREYVICPLCNRKVIFLQS